LVKQRVKEEFVNTGGRPGRNDAPSSGMTMPDMRKSIGFLLRLAYQRNQALFQRHSIDASLTSVQMAVLHVLAEKRASSLKDLRKLTAMDAATTTGVVERLAARALITLTPDPTDRRRTIARLNAKGRDLTKRMLPTLKEIADATLEPLSPHERVTLIGLLERISDANKEDEDDAGIP
jgi:DNA-binding MarR family transcriptional regulator